MLNYIISRVFSLSLVLFGAAVALRSLGLSLLIMRIVWDTADSKICAFMVL